MGLPATDNFDRANSPTLGVTWTDMQAARTLSIASNQATETAAANTEAFWGADVFANNHYSQLRFVSGTFCGPMARALGLDATGVGYIFGSDGNVYRKAGTVYTEIGFTESYTFGDIGRIEPVDTTIKVLKNGVQVGEDITDGTYSGGSAGISASNAQVDDWEGGNLGGQPGTSVLNLIVG
jgi:hypothetical protein